MRYPPGFGKLIRLKRRGREYGNFKFKFRGKYINTGTADKRAAEKFRREYNGRDAKGDANVRVADAPVSRLLGLVESDYARRGRASEASLKSRLKHLASLGAVPAAELKAHHLNAYVDQRLAANAQPATVNKELQVLRRAYSLGVQHEYVERAPKIELLEERNVRDVGISRDEYAALCAVLREPVRLLFILAYHIGWRAGKLLELTWSQVDFQAGVIYPPARQRANKWVGPAPIYGDARTALLVAFAEHEKHWPDVPLVLHRGGQPVVDYRDAWHDGRKSIGRPELHFHDLRHVAVTNMVDAGIDESRAMSIVGHKTSAMLRRYRIVSVKHTVDAGHKLEEFLKVKAAGAAAGTVM